MNPTVFEMNGIGLQLAQPTLVYLTGIDREEKWKARGLSGHNEDMEWKARLETEEVEAIRNLKESAEGQKEIQKFTHECKAVMQAILLGNYTWLDTYLEDREFIFLCGLHRSGGTYLLDEFSKIFDFPYQKFHCMHDDLPEFFPVLYAKTPHYFMQYIAEVAQFLVIVKQSVPWKIVIKKRAIWTFAIESLMHIFRDRLTIFMHVRHPLSWAWADTALREGKGASADITVAGSMKQYVEIYDGTLKKEESPIQLMLRFWRLFHAESARKGAAINVLPFGHASEILKKVGSRHKEGYEPSPFNPTPRDYDKYQEYFPEAQGMIDDVRADWSKCGLSFPDIELL